MKDLTKGNIYKTFLLFSVPMILAGFLSQAYQIIDTVIAGKFLDAHGLAAIGSTSSYISFINFLFWGYYVGFSIYIAVLFGARKFERIKTAFITNFIVGSAAILLISVLSVTFRNPIFDLLRVNSEYRSDAETYFVIYMLGLFVVMGNNYGLYALNSFGIGSFPLLMSAVSTVVHIVGNIVAVKYLNAGVAGLAYSSIISALIVDVLYYIKVSGCFKEMGVGKNAKMFDLSSLKGSFRYSLPNTFQQGIMYFASFIISPIVNGIGTSATAAYTVVNRVYEFDAGIYGNASKCVSNYTAQSMGAKKVRKPEKGRWRWLSSMLWCCFAGNSPRMYICKGNMSVLLSCRI